MSWAFDGVPWSEVPDSEKFAIWCNQALVRDSFLNYQELCIKVRVLVELEKERRR